MANSVYPDQTAPIRAVCSGSMLFASILYSSVMLCNYLQQTTSAEDIFRHIFFLALEGLRVRTSFFLIFQPKHMLKQMGKNIRIYHWYEGRVEKSVPRIAFWHHEACRVMTNGDPEGRIFLSYPHTNNGFFLVHHCFYLFIYFKISFQKSLNTLRCNFT